MSTLLDLSVHASYARIHIVHEKIREASPFVARDFGIRRKLKLRMIVARQDASVLRW